MFLLPKPWKRPLKRLSNRNLRLERTTPSEIINGKILGIRKVLIMEHKKSYLKILRKLNLKVVELGKSKTIFMRTGITTIMKRRDH